MTDHLAASLISYILGQYIEIVSPSAVHASIFSGSIHLENVSIKPTVLADHQIPINVKKGTIGKISASISWSTLLMGSSNPSVLEISDVFILGEPSSSTYIQNDYTMPTPSEFEKFCVEKKIDQNEMMNSTFGAVLKTLVLKIKNIHIRIQHKVGNKEFSCGIILPSLSVEIANKDTLSKSLFLKDLSVYFDVDSPSFQSSSFSEFMLDLMTSPHQYIIENLSLNGSYEFDALTKISLNVNRIHVLFDAHQFLLARELQKAKVKLDQQKFFKSCGKPERLPRSPRSSTLWWRFLNNCSIKKCTPFKFDPSNALLFLKERESSLPTLLKFIENNINHKDLKPLEDKYGTNVLFSMTNYARLVFDRQRNQIQQILESEEISFSKTKLVSEKGISYFLDVKNIDLEIKTNPDHLFCRFVLEDLSGCITQNKEYSFFNLKINKIFLSKPTQERVFWVDQSQKDYSLLLEGNIQQLSTYKLFISSLNIVFDWPFIQDFLQNFKYSSLPSLSLPEYKSPELTPLLIDSYLSFHSTFNAEVHLESPKVFLQELQMRFDYIFLRSNLITKREIKDTNTYYDHFSGQLQNFQILLANKFICQTFSTSINFFLF